MSENALNNLTEEAYLEIERASDTKHQYIDGELFAMTGASEKHNLIVANIIRELGNQLKHGPCRVYPSDMRLKIDAANMFTYPDVMIVCGERHFSDDRQDTLTNPDVIIEVLSDSTESYDRGGKFEAYRKLPSLKEYILVSQHRRKLERFFKIHFKADITQKPAQTLRSRQTRKAPPPFPRRKGRQGLYP